MVRAGRGHGGAAAFTAVKNNRGAGGRRGGKQAEAYSPSDDEVEDFDEVYNGSLHTRSARLRPVPVPSSALYRLPSPSLARLPSPSLARLPSPSLKVWDPPPIDLWRRGPFHR